MRVRVVERPFHNLSGTFSENVPRSRAVDRVTIHFEPGTYVAQDLLHLVGNGSIGSWANVYTIAYRPDLVPAGIKFDSWADLWKPELKGKISAPDFDASHLVAVAAVLSGGDAASLSSISV